MQLQVQGVSIFALADKSPTVVYTLLAAKRPRSLQLPCFRRAGMPAATKHARASGLLPQGPQIRRLHEGASCTLQAPKAQRSAGRLSM
jgi:hypothetical protein